MKILFASDSFKGSLTSEKINELLQKSAEKIFPGCETEGLVIADGGEGTIDAVISAKKGSRKAVKVHGPLMERVEAWYGVVDSDVAVIEMAAASGLPMVPYELRNPLNTTSFGTGELIRDALESGFKHLVIAIGGSATNDGGMGAMKALGVRFLDHKGMELSGCGSDLGKVASIDMSDLCPQIRTADITVMCDVKNPLTGPDGATYIFGKQKGGTPEILEELEAGMKNYAGILRNQFGIDLEHKPGAGAAGGMGAALCGFLHATVKSGIDTVLDLVDFEQRLEGVDLVITGEGRIDWQSVNGKVPSGVGMRCKKKGIPAIAIVGGIGDGADSIYQYGVNSMISTIDGPMKIGEAMERAEELYCKAAERTFRLIQAGMQIHK